MTIRIIIGILLISLSSFADSFNNDTVIGKWLNADKDAHIQIYKSGIAYYGKIIWMKNPVNASTGKPEMDEKNPDSALQNKPILNLVILKGFTYNGEEYSDGTIYDPKGGKTYTCKMWLTGLNQLNIRGYVGIFYRTEVWTRVP
ncbi:MAG: DUF2147 domain-containing protein [Cytophagales bacterium]|nr:DUF2147 domain-containing protein [Cytophaga sp.]